MSGAAVGVDELKNSTPRFEGWNLVPLAGIPIIGLPYAGRFNTISDTWADSAGILKNLLAHSGEKLVRSADNYTLVNQVNEKTIGKILP
ncbi:hypothetical protein [Streptosporangium lutulentum]|uniref:Uncharacterized protein n=1 Tax=Streptosporangium lutulentum TaxID=1461250 RepID=A0ABT9QRM2_9ACTN|nr:hypothetical protein [Streptosporangium lutulentum]MDP9849389.1 hypothetical protein [Streptosporangium lutulentum]